jgi:hypothetical protein
MFIVLLGVDAVNWLAQHLRVSKKEAEKVGQILLTRHYIHHICYKHHFEDKYIFFRFTVGSIPAYFPIFAIFRFLSYYSIRKVRI